MVDPREKEMVERAMSIIGSSGFAVMSRKEQSQFLSAVLLVAYDLMRTIEDDGFVRGWLEMALADLPTSQPALNVRRPS